VAGIYRALGLLTQGQLVEVDRSELVAGYLGQTAMKTADVVKSAVGGVLFIDEAYSLAGDQYGTEAVDTLVKEMEDRRHDLVVIVAGYPEPMAFFIAQNPGLASRFRTTIEFADYSDDELVGIFRVLAEGADYDLPADVEARFREMLKGIRRGPTFGNGRLLPQRARGRDRPARLAVARHRGADRGAAAHAGARGPRLRVGRRHRDEALNGPTEGPLVIDPETPLPPQPEPPAERPRRRPHHEPGHAGRPGPPTGGPADRGGRRHAGPDARGSGHRPRDGVRVARHLARGRRRPPPGGAGPDDPHPTAARRDRGVPALRRRHRPAARAVVAGQPHRRRRHRAADPRAGHQDQPAAGRRAGDQRRSSSEASSRPSSGRRTTARSTRRCAPSPTRPRRSPPTAPRSTS
jgi:hypothetical protein